MSVLELEFGKKKDVDNVHTIRFGLSRIGGGSARTRHVFGTSQCLQGLASGSSPTSGTVFPQVSGVLTPGVCTKALASGLAQADADR